MKDRLFVPLSNEPFDDFAKFGKQVEIRKCARNFTERTVFPGRRVELRRGYSGKDALWGNITDTVVGALEDIFQKFDLKMVEPRAENVRQAISENLELLGPAPQYIGFSVDLD